MVRLHAETKGKKSLNWFCTHHTTATATITNSTGDREGWRDGGGPKKKIEEGRNKECHSLSTIRQYHYHYDR